MEWQVGRFKIQLAIQQWFRLDGGVIFSGVPKEKWRNFSMGVATLFDRRNRVQLAVNCFLVTSPNGRKFLIDTSFGGIGRWKKKTVNDYRMQDGFNLFECGHLNHGLLPPDFVIPTHLHFDHAGGCVKPVNGKLEPAFPRALHVFHEDEIVHAFRGHPKTRSSYLRETVDGIKVILDNTDLWRMKGDVLGSELLGEGITLFRTRGHTPGHLSVKIESEGQVAFIPGALTPTRWHINVLACGVGNDSHALEAVEHKISFLEPAAKENWLLLLEHDPDIAGYAVEAGGGNFRFAPWKSARGEGC
ncbi:MAG: hypothetical protein A3A32_00620 [Candidatus Wildermuthbacteria bacterium RIFCSPLOWO2_01_FULL_48_35]|uniref:Metallo-beta-lactamase domain-containing protein n=1 Tax=Candidatus Wildermuthbacteria bacterium RIFCSPLOWO2_01_FULL_48_35 TaxID=1802463 RepID=A0A1G2RNZ6_9BACT|nr:MAG: hypothetical protein UY15_C0015G0006 [Parcubacteria group bacterium GW2011_GWA2_47_9]OHA74547.1 MAG: hypothetical protein A3A32_00620 [Candidatus Wildermuthbacteria bacterium RIFCSPLOWO2_01_FULL_48_35]